ncbi:rRNA-processing protein fcf2-like [Carex rostrata]
MRENKSEIGLTWCPKISFTQNGSKKTASTLKIQDSVWKPETQLVDGLFVPPRDPQKLNKLLRKNAKDTSGKSWFDMPAPTITPELKADLEILRLRSVIDPKQHFKKAVGNSKTLPKYFQVGTVIEPASEYFSGRLTKKERKPTLADELLSDPTFKAYKKRKIVEIHESRRPRDVEKWKIKGRQTLKRAKQRREH